MKEELGFVGDQYNQINTCFTVGYVIGQIPSNLSLHYVKPRFFFRMSESLRLSIRGFAGEKRYLVKRDKY